MPQRSSAALQRGLAGGERGGIYFLYGDDDYLKEEAAAAILAAHLTDATIHFNLDQLRGGELDAERLSSCLQTPPLMADWRVVVVRDAQLLTGSPALRGAIESVLEKPPPGVVLVLLARIPPGSQAKFYKRLQREAIAVSCVGPDAQDIPGWLMARAEELKVELEPAAARTLAAAIGPHLETLCNELAKLRDYVGGDHRIEQHHVQEMVQAAPVHNRWEWMDMVGERRFEKARGALRGLLDGGENGVGLVMGLGTHLLRLSMAAAGGEAALAQELPQNQRRWLAPRLGRQARGWTIDGLDAALKDLLRADCLLKSTALDDYQVLEEMLLRFKARTGP